MTVLTSANKAVWIGNGATTVFSFAFPIPTTAAVQVIYTSPYGLQAVQPSSAYTLNAGPSGGTLTFSLLGAPIPAGSSLTLIRTVPYTQPTSFSNQGGLWPAVVEAADDNAEYQIQQLASLAAAAIVINPADPATIVTTLPPAAVRAGQTLIFDSSGNVTTGAVATGATVSTPMQPVVSASSTAKALALLGGFPSYANIAALRLNSGTASPVAYVQGYANPADHGEGAFVYVSTDTTSSDKQYGN